MSQKSMQDLRSQLGSELETIKPTTGKKHGGQLRQGAPSAKLPFTPTCVTQKPLPAQFQGKPNPLALQVGLFGNIPRWEKGSTINFTAYSHGFPSEEDATHAANALNEACEIWNGHDVGVTFKWVDTTDDAAFVLAYGGDQGRTLAAAFFPDDAVLNTLNVYSLAFTPEWKPFQVNVYLHELGHVMGLRHEFAIEREGGAVLFGVRNQLSVMNYRPDPPEIQDSDVRDCKAFYDYTADTFQSLKIVKYKPDN